MNFGKNSTQKKRKQLSSASSKRGKRAGVTFLRILFLSFAAVCVIFCCMGIGAFRAILDTAPDISDVNIMPSGNATFVYAPRQVEVFLRDVVRPVLDAHKEELGVTAEINV